MPIAHGHGARLVPLHRRIVLLVRSRTRGLAGVVVLMGLLSLTIRPDFILWIGGIVVSFMAIPLMLAAGPRELTGATAALWLQKPVDELRFVLARFGETLLATVGVAVLFGLAWVLVGQGLGWDPFRPPILVLPLGALASLVIAAMAFGAAAWLPRGSRAAVLILIVLGFGLFDPEMSDPELVRQGPAALARLVLLPLPDILRFGLGLTGDLPFSAQPIAKAVLHALAWTTLGALGVWRSAARGGIGFR